MKLGPFDVPGFYVGDCRALLAQLPDASVQCVVTSPPYWGLRDYGEPGQIGNEATWQEYVGVLVDVLADARRVLTDDGTLWLNLGDTYITSPAGNKPGQFSSSTLTNPWRHEETRVRAGRTPPNRNSRRRDGAPVVPATRHRAQGLPEKSKVGIPWRVAFALQDDDWILRQDVIADGQPEPGGVFVWHKPQAMPEAVRDRPTTAHEYVFLFSKKPKYFYDFDAVSEATTSTKPSGNGYRRPQRQTFADGTPRGSDEAWSDVGGRRNLRSVWTIQTQALKAAHFATFPERLAEICILAGSRPGDVVLDPFFGSGTVGKVAEKHGRLWLGFDISEEYAKIAARRTAQRSLPGTAIR